MKLPQVRAGMTLDQAMLIELLSMLVEEGIITETKAVDRYLARKKQFSRSTEGFGNWDMHDDCFGQDSKVEVAPTKPGLLQRLLGWLK